MALNRRSPISSKSFFDCIASGNEVLTATLTPADPAAVIRSVPMEPEVIETPTAAESRAAIRELVRNAGETPDVADTYIDSEMTETEIRADLFDRMQARTRRTPTTPIMATCLPGLPCPWNRSTPPARRFACKRVSTARRSSPWKTRPTTSTRQRRPSAKSTIITRPTTWTGRWTSSKGNCDRAQIEALRTLLNRDENGKEQ